MAQVADKRGSIMPGRLEDLPLDEEIAIADDLTTLAPAAHAHPENAPTGHNHDASYSGTTHTHPYSEAGHTHDTSHNHDTAYSATGHTHAAAQPAAHKATHASGGSDALAPADIGAAASTHNHDALYPPIAHTHPYAPTAHDHNATYYTESEVDTALAGKAPTAHNHDAAYFTEAEVTTLLAGKSDASHTHGGGGGGYTPDWIAQSGAGSLFALRGLGDPVLAARELDMAAIAGPTPTQIGVTVARCVMFRLPKTLTTNTFRVLGVGNTTNLYKFGIYAVGTGSSKLWDSGTVTTTAGGWLSVVMSGVTLQANTDYWLCITAVATGTTAGFRSPPAPVHANEWGANAAPLGNRAIGLPVLAQFAVSAGVFPATLPAVVAAAYSAGATGSVPIGFVEGTSA